VAADGTHAASSTLTILTTANSAASTQLAGLGAFSLLSLGVIVLRRPRRRAAPWLLCLSLVLLLVACGKGGGGGDSGPAATPPGSYMVSITGTAGAANRSAAVSVTVQ